MNFYIFGFTLKNLKRHAGRSFFIGFSVTISVVICVWVISFFHGLNFQIEKAVVNTNIGYYQILEDNYNQTQDPDTPLEWNNAIEKNFLKYEFNNFSPELVLDTNLSTPEGSASLLTIGIIPKNHLSVIALGSNIIEGDFFKTQTEGIIIGKSLAEDFKFQLNDTLILNYQNHKGELVSEILPIVGIYKFNSPIFEKRYTYLTQPSWQKLYFGQDTHKELFHRVTLNTEGLFHDPKISLLAQDLKLNSKNWKNLNPEMGVILDFHDGMIKFFLIIIGITVTMTILTPTRMLWAERLKEFKMMNILGFSKNKIWQMGAIEVGVMIGCSYLAALLLLYLILSYQAIYGIDFNFLNKTGLLIERAGIQLPRHIFPRFEMVQLLIAFIFVSFATIVSYVLSIKACITELQKEV